MFVGSIPTVPTEQKTAEKTAQGGPASNASIGGQTSHPLGVVKLVSFHIRVVEAVSSSLTT